MFKILTRFALILFLLGIISACAKIPLLEESGPQWISGGSGSYSTPQGKVFYGVGTARGIQNRMLLRATADNAARDELAQLLENYTARLVRSALPASLSQAKINEYAGQLAQLNLQRAIVVEHWQDPNGDGSLFALCRLDLSVYIENLQRYRTMDATLRQAMVAKADEVHAQMNP
jgi:hypothetical protein